jgi:hypothetical protein
MDRYETIIYWSEEDQAYFTRGSAEEIRGHITYLY